MDIFLTTLFIVICILLIVVVLLQKGKGGGLGAAFGGAGSSAFGTRTGDVFTWVTIVLTALFLLLAIVTTLFFRPARVTPQGPVFDPPPMAISDPISVKIMRERGAKYYYTLDGSVPTNKSKEFSAPLRTDPGTTYKAVTYKSGMYSAVVVASYPKPGPATGPAATTSAPASIPAGGTVVTTMPATAPK